MKKVIVSIILVIFITGCQSQKAEEKYKGVVAKKDYIAQGMDYLAKSDIQRAVQSFDQAIKQDPTNPQNYIILGQVYLRLKESTRAIDSFSAAVRVDPENGEAYYLLAMSKALNNDKTGAIKAAQKSVDIFVKERDEENFKRSIALLRSLMEGDQATKELPALQAPQAQPAQ